MAQQTLQLCTQALATSDCHSCLLCIYNRHSRSHHPAKDASAACQYLHVHEETLNPKRFFRCAYMMLHPQDSYSDSVMKHDLHAHMHIVQLQPSFSACNWLWKAKAVQCRIGHSINTGQISFVHALPGHAWPVKQAQTQTRITWKRDISRIGVEQNPNLAVLCIVCLISTDELHDN